MCYITKNKTTGITCLTFKCKLAFPTIFNDIHKRVLLILSIYQIVLYRCSHENKVSLLQLHKQCIFMTGFGNRVSHKIWQLKCKKFGKVGRWNVFCGFMYPRQISEVIKGTCHVGMIEEAMEISKKISNK